MPRPTDKPDWASDANYPAGVEPEAGTPTKIEPSAGKQAIGWRPTEFPPPQYLNWYMNLVAQWIEYLDEFLHGVKTAVFHAMRDGYPPDDTSHVPLFAVSGAVAGVDLQWNIMIAGKGMEIAGGRRILEVRVYAENNDITPAPIDLRAVLSRSYLDDAVNYDNTESTLDDDNTTGDPVGLQVITLTATPPDDVVDEDLYTYHVVMLPVANTGAVVRWRRVEVDYDFPAP